MKRTDRSPWNWLLVIPIAIPVLTPLFNFDEPRFLGFPAFYWLQFSFILIGVATTSIVYRMTTPAPAATAPAAASRAAASPAAASSEAVDE